MLLATATAFGQAGGAPPAKPGGEAEVAFQGFYLGGNDQQLVNTTGTAIHFREFLPHYGFLSGSLEGYGSQNRLQTGENFLELRGAPWMGKYWTVTAGDFRTPAALVEFPFTNIFNPEIDGRGIKVEAAHAGARYLFFMGEETLTAGPRLPYRMLAPQNLMGVSAARTVARHLDVGARLMQFSASPAAIAENSYLFPSGRTVGVVRTAALQMSYTPAKRLRFYAELSRPTASTAPAMTSTLAGFAWEDRVFTFKANYVNQGVLYFPLAGYFAGDRRGPFAEARLRPWKRLEFYASANQYRNNLERDPGVPSLTSASGSAGISAVLPGKLSANGQISTVRFSDRSPGQGAATSKDRLLSGTLSRTFGIQTVHLDWRDMRLELQPAPQRQRSAELQDNFQFKQFSVGAAVRRQEVTGIERRNSLFFRGMGQVNIGRLTAFGNVEIGNDLANQTVFSTEAYKTSVIGAALRLPAGWTVQGEIFRNQLNFDLNPMNIFLLENGAALAGASPAMQSLAAVSQWSLYFRVSKQIRWGGGLPSENPGPAGLAAVSLNGTVEGVVRLKTIAGASLVAAIPVSLDGTRTAVTGADGRYLFANVPEGAHEVGLSPAELPADFDPGEARQLRLLVQSRRAARADFEVLPLVAISGKVAGPEKAPLEDIVIHLFPGDRYTTTNHEGAFTFYNVHEGEFEIALDAKTLPEGGEPSSPVAVRIGARVGPPPPLVEFTFAIHSEQKPIRKVFDRK